jgi:hypothetical protein
MNNSTSGEQSSQGGSPVKTGMNRREMVVLLGGAAGASGIATLLHAADWKASAQENLAGEGN